MAKNRLAGFTLIEILIAISILSIGLLMLSYMQAVAARANALSNEITQANSIAQQQIESLAIQNFDSDSLRSRKNLSFDNDADSDGISDPLDFDRDGDGIPYIAYIGGAVQIVDSDDEPDWPDASHIEDATIVRSNKRYYIIYNIVPDNPISDSTKTLCVIVYWYENNPDASGRGRIKCVRMVMVISKWRNT